MESLRDTTLATICPFSRNKPSVELLMPTLPHSGTLPSQLVTQCPECAPVISPDSSRSVEPPRECMNFGFWRGGATRSHISITDKICAQIVTFSTLTPEPGMTETVHGGARSATQNDGGL